MAPSELPPPFAWLIAVLGPSWVLVAATVLPWFLCRLG